MLVKLRAGNRLTLPKSLLVRLGPIEYFDVESRDGQIILTPVRMQLSDAVRAKLAALDLGAADIAAALKWARLPP